MLQLNINRPVQMFLLLLILIPIAVETRSQAVVLHRSQAAPILVLRDSNSPSISADGQRIAVSPEIGLDEVSENDLRLPITGLALSPDGRFLATESLNYVLTWDAKTGRLLAALLHDADDRDRVRRVAFSSDGRYLAMSSMNEVVKVWRTADVFAEASVR